MNTCVQDAFNLAWKLAYVLKGYAGERLLGSYSDERAPVGKQIVLRANQSRLDYAPLNACFRVPTADNPVAAGIARFRDPGPEGVKARRAVQEALELKNTEFNAQGVEMNQRYSSTAVLEDPTAGPEQWVRDPELYLQATTCPGAKVPHAWLIGRDGRRLSTLDITGHGKFTVVTGIAGAAWVEAVKTLNLPFLTAVVIGSGQSQDLYCDWQRLRETEEAGSILVRPDGYIAWREASAVHDVSVAQDKLVAALGCVLSNPLLASMGATNDDVGRGNQTRLFV